MLNEKNISKLIVILPLASLLFGIGYLTYIIVDLQKERTELMKRDIVQRYYTQEENYLKEKVTDAIKLLSSINSQTETRLQNELKLMVDNAIYSANNIYEKHKSDQSLSEIKKKVLDALEPIRFGVKNQGYFLIADLNNNHSLIHPMEKFRNVDMTNFKDIKGLNILDTYKKIIAASPNEEGFVKIYFNKPDDQKNEYPKLVFVKYFKPFNWIIGTGFYIDEFEDAIKEEAKKLLADIRFKNDGYIWSIDKEYTLLTNPTTTIPMGENIKSLKDAAGKYFIQEALEKAKDGGGIIKYLWGRKGEAGTSEKMGYAAEFKDWEWVLCANYYTDDLTAMLKEQNLLLEEAQRALFNKIAVLYMVGIFVVLGISLLFSKKIVEIYNSYKARVESKEKELESLNQDLERRISEELQKSKEKDHVIFEQTKMQAMSELLMNLAHQWRQPLSIISIHTQNLIDKLQDEGKADEYTTKTLNMLIDETELLSDTISKFSKFYNSEYGDTILLINSIKDIQNLTDKTFEQENIVITYDIEENIALEASPTDLLEIFTSLLFNVADIAKERRIPKAKVAIDARTDEKEIVIMVSDNCGGVDTSLLPDKLFEPYTTTKFKSRGKGLSLYFVKIIVEQNLKGNVRVYNDKEGSVFEIRIPKIH